MSNYLRYMLGYRETPESPLVLVPQAGVFDTPEAAERERTKYHGVKHIARVTIDDVVLPDYLQLADRLALQLIERGVDHEFVLDWLRAGPELFYQQAQHVLDAYEEFVHAHQPPEARDWGEEQAALWALLRRDAGGRRG